MGGVVVGTRLWETTASSSSHDVSDQNRSKMSLRKYHRQLIPSSSSLWRPGRVREATRSRGRNESEDQRDQSGQEEAGGCAVAEQLELLPPERGPSLPAKDNGVRGLVQHLTGPLPRLQEPPARLPIPTAVFARISSPAVGRQAGVSRPAATFTTAGGPVNRSSFVLSSIRWSAAQRLCQWKVCER